MQYYLPSAFNNSGSRLISRCSTSYLICTRSPKCPGCLVPPPRFVRLRTEKKGGKWVRYPRIELDRWLESLPLQEKAEIEKTDISTESKVSTDKFKGCLLSLTVVKEIEDANMIGSNFLKSLTAEEKEKK